MTIVLQSNSDRFPSKMEIYRFLLYTVVFSAEQCISNHYPKLTQLKQGVLS